MRNFSHHRGTVTGILKGYSGLSAAILTVLHSTVLQQSTSSLFLLLLLGIPIISALFGYMVRTCEPASGPDDGDHKFFVWTQVVSGILGICLVIATVVTNDHSLTAIDSFFLVALLVIFLLTPFAILMSQSISSNQLGPGEVDGEPFLTPSSSIIQAEEQIHFTCMQILGMAKFWLLCAVYVLGISSGVALVNNLELIGIAPGSDDWKILFTLLSFFNFLGLLGGGFVSENHARFRQMPCTVWTTGTYFIMAVVYVAFAYSYIGILYVGTCLLGTCFGFQTSVMITTASEIFGLKSFSIIYNTISMGRPLFSFIFSELAHFVSDTEVGNQDGLSPTKAVLQGSKSSFRRGFLVLASTCILGSALSMILTSQLKPTYEPETEGQVSSHDHCA